MRSELRHITRFDYGNNRGWWVRFARQKNGKQRVTSKLFSDSVWGGKRKSLKAAIRWRNRELPKIAPPYLGSANARRQPGEGYVYRGVRKGFDGRDIPYWAAVVRRAGGKRAATTFSVERWGEAGARLRAERFVRRARLELGLSTGGRIAVHG